MYDGMALTYIQGQGLGHGGLEDAIMSGFFRSSSAIFHSISEEATVPTLLENI